MEPTTPTAGRGSSGKTISLAWPVLVALFGAVLMAFIAESVAIGVGFFVWMLATAIGSRRQVFGRRTEYLWPLTTATIAVAVASLLKLAS